MTYIITIVLLLIAIGFFNPSLLLFLVALFLIVVFAPLVLVFQIFRKLFRKESLNKYIHVIAVSLDQLGAALIYGEEDWCISSIAYYDYQYKNKNKWFMHLINFLFRDKDHCKNSFFVEYEELKRYPK